MRAILTYHSIDDSGSPISVPTSTFVSHARWLRSRRVRVVSIPELLALPVDTDAVALTFDDGFCNFATDAASLLDGLPVTLFVVTDHVGKSNEWGGRAARGIPTLPLLDWPQLTRLAQAGVTLAAHTRTHADLTTLPSDSLEDELGGCAEILRNATGAEVAGFAYPYGARNKTVTSAVQRIFQWACTTDLRALGADEAAAELPRLDMYYFRQPGRLESWGTAAFHAYLAARRVFRGVRLAGLGAMAGGRGRP